MMLSISKERIHLLLMREMPTILKTFRLDKSTRLRTATILEFQNMLLLRIAVAHGERWICDVIMWSLKILRSRSRTQT